MSDFSQDAAQELGEGPYVFVHGMGLEDTLRHMCAHDAHHVHDVQDVYDALISIARDVDFSSSQAWHRCPRWSKMAPMSSVSVLMIREV